MKKKIKLRDLTSEQFESWMKDNCGHAEYVDCTDCPFFFSNCIVDEKKSWVKNKDLYSDKFLDIEIEVEEFLLTKEEKEYLEGVIRPFKDKVLYIKKINSFDTSDQRIGFRFNDDLFYSLPYFEKNKYYKSMEVDKKYTLKDLGLFEEKK